MFLQCQISNFKSQFYNLKLQYVPAVSVQWQCWPPFGQWVPSLLLPPPSVGKTPPNQSQQFLWGGGVYFFGGNFGSSSLKCIMFPSPATIPVTRVSMGGG